MKVIFLGGLYRPEIQEEINRKSGKMPYFAANNHQWAIIKGLEIANRHSNVILNAMHLRSFPIYRDIYVKGTKWTYNEVIINKDIGFLNVFGIKHVWRALALTKELHKEIKNSKDEKLVVMTYGMHTPYLFATFLNKRISKKDVQWCCIVPEIPRYYIGIRGKGKIYGFLKRIDWAISFWLLKKANIYQLLTRKMAELLEIHDKKYIVIEGVMDIEVRRPIEPVNQTSNSERIVLYTGTTNLEFGIVDLLDAFSKIKDERFKLIICGTGSGDRKIREYMQYDDRIEWKGFVSRGEAFEMQRAATVLVNPRRPDQEFTLYSFPSKTMEYLFSGTPVLMHKLEGIPPEYDKYLNYFESTDIEGIAKSIIEVCNWSETRRERYARTVIDFIEAEKSIVPQGRKLYNFLISQFEL